MARIGIMKMEGLDETQLEIEHSEAGVDTVPATMLESEELDGELQSQAAGIEEAGEIEGNIQDLHDGLVKVKEEGRDLTELEADTVAKTMEHYRNRLGYDQPKLMTMEGYAGSVNKAKQLDLTIESIGHTVTNTIKAKFSIYLWLVTAIYKKTSLQKKILLDLRADLDAASSAFAESKAPESVSGRFVNDLTTGNGDTKASQVIANVENYTSRITSGNHSKVLTQATAALVDINNTVRSIWIASDSKDVEGIEANVAKLRKLVTGLSAKEDYVISLNGNAVAKITENSDGEVKVRISTSEAKTDGGVVALTKQEKDKLVGLCQRLIAETAVSDELEAMAKKIQTVYGFTMLNDAFRLPAMVLRSFTGGISHLYAAQDLRLAMSATTNAEQLRQIFFEDLTQRARVIRSIIAYIKTSSK